MARGRTIQIYLPDGDPRGVRIAGLTTSIVQVVEIPRSLLAKFLEMPQAQQVGVYFLVKDAEADDDPMVYIGQTGDLGKRLYEHHNDPKKDFWNRAFVMVSLTQSLTQTHALYLEWKSISSASVAGRYTVVNGNAGSKPYTPAPMEADCLDIFDTLRTLLATLGQPAFEPYGKAKQVVEPTTEMYFCKGNGYDAVAEYDEEGLVVLKGSKARKEMVPSMAPMSAGKRRLALIDEGKMKLQGDCYIFQDDVTFRSPSGASDVVVGASSNGWMLWKDKNGRTLDELKRQPKVDPAG